MTSDPRIRQISAQAYRIPTDMPEADGTLAWDHTVLITVQIEAGEASGFGYTYADAAIVRLIRQTLAQVVVGCDALDISSATEKLRRSVRNLGRSGLAATAISAVDLALWDLKAKLLKAPLARLLGRSRVRVPIYGSGGFTSYSDSQLRDQLARWVERDGCRWVKMKIGSDRARDPTRVRVARQAVADKGLFVDANGAFSAKVALDLAERIADQQVSWFEEPVSSDDLAGLALVRQRAPAGMEIAAGEYAYTPDDFERLTAGPAVDVLQADITRCGGVTGFLQAAGLAAARHMELSCHCAPAAHLAVACAVPHLRHVEWFHDHVRIEQMLFDGAPLAREGAIAPDPDRPGLGIALKLPDAERFLVH